MINNLPYYLLGAEELDACAERITNIITESLAEEVTLQPLLTLITKDRHDLKNSLGNSRGSAFTAKIAAADHDRDDAFVVFRNVCENATRRRRMPDHSAAGELLMRLIHAQGYSLQELGNSAQTGALNALFLSLKTPAAVAAIAHIDAYDDFTALREAQQAFENLVNSRTDEQAAKDYLRLAKAKSKLGKRLQAMFSVIDTLDEADTEQARPVIDVLIAKINEAIVTIIAPARARRSRAATASDKPDAPDAAPTP